ncbi:hypothetical protein VTK26DRAFT_1996 [Humicola hyalothermophila]
MGTVTSSAGVKDMCCGTCIHRVLCGSTKPAGPIHYTRVGAERPPPQNGFHSTHQTERRVVHLTIAVWADKYVVPLYRDLPAGSRPWYVGCRPALASSIIEQPDAIESGPIERENTVPFTVQPSGPSKPSQLSKPLPAPRTSFGKHPSVLRDEAQSLAACYCRAARFAMTIGGLCAGAAQLVVTSPGWLSKPKNWRFPSHCRLPEKGLDGLPISTSFTVKGRN